VLLIALLIVLIALTVIWTVYPSQNDLRMVIQTVNKDCILIPDLETDPVRLPLLIVLYWGTEEFEKCIFIGLDPVLCVGHSFMVSSSTWSLCSDCYIFVEDWNVTALPLFLSLYRHGCLHYWHCIIKCLFTLTSLIYVVDNVSVYHYIHQIQGLAIFQGTM
jgi:hypothetical protein